MIKKLLFCVGILGVTSLPSLLPASVSEVSVEHLAYGTDLNPYLEKSLPFDVTIHGIELPSSQNAIEEWIACMSDCYHSSLSSFSKEQKPLPVRVSFWPAEGKTKAPAVILAHPTGGDHKHMQALSETLKKQGYHVLCPHSEGARTTGKGLSKRQNSSSILSACYDLIETIKVFGAYEGFFDGFHLLGLSRGAAAAYFLTFGDMINHFMKDHPKPIKCIKSLTLVGTVPVIQMMDEHYQKPSIPITFMHGTEDRYVRPEIARRCAERIGAAWIAIEGGGHGLWQNIDEVKDLKDAEDWSKFAWVLDRPWRSFAVKNPEEIEKLMRTLSSKDAWFYALGDNAYPGDEALQEKRRFEQASGGQILPRYTELGDFTNPYGVFRLSVRRGVTMTSSKEGYERFIEKLLDVLARDAA